MTAMPLIRADSAENIAVYICKHIAPDDRTAGQRYGKRQKNKGSRKIVEFRGHLQQQCQQQAQKVCAYYIKNRKVKGMYKGVPEILVG